MANEYRVCAYWQEVNINGTKEYRCVALNPLFTSYNWKIDDISCFHRDPSNPDYGLCNGEGTCWECSKYSPGGLGFGKLDPSTGLYKLPFVHVIYNIRALLSRCCYWDNAKEIFFTINSSTGEIIRPPNHCTKGTAAKNWNSPDNPEYNLPCNGCKTSCPYYTGVEWEHCIDDKLKRGDFITAKQIQELRYYADDWNAYDKPYLIFKSRFLDADIFAWAGQFISADDGELRDIAKPGTYNFPTLNKVEINLDKNSSEKTKVTPTVASVGTAGDTTAPDFPTLIRDLSDSLLLKPKFIFPENNYIHKHWKPDGNKITVIGYFSTPNKVYLVNSAFVDIPSIILKMDLESKSGKLWTNEELELLNKEMEKFVEVTLWNNPEYIYSASPDNSGIFYLYNVDLKVGKSQDLLVISKDINDQWVFNKITVHDYFYHIFVMQTRWESNWWTDREFNSTGKVSGKFHFMESTNDLDITFRPSITIKNFFHHDVQVIQSLFTEYSKYYYYRVKVIVTDYMDDAVSPDCWDFIDNCGRILLKVPDIRINRFYGWGIDFVKLKSESGQEVRFEVEYNSSGEEFPSNYVILKPIQNEKFKKFSKLTSKLYIKYHYYEERPTPVSLGKNESLVLPTPSDVTATSKFKTSFTNDSFVIENIDTGTIKFRVDVADETGRIIGVKTIKFVSQYHQVKCRDFEIFYIWGAEYNIKLLSPDGFVAGKDRIKFKYIDMGTTVVFETPYCGDHEYGLITHRGPMWFPYTDCDNDIKYFPHTRCPNWCFLPVEGSPGATPAGVVPEHDYRDHRLRGPDEYHAWITGKVWPLGLLNAACWHKYSYGFYKRFSDIFFGGRAATRGEVNIPEFLSFGWALPKFGNVLREMSIVNRCVDYVQFFNKELLTFDFKWMPLTEFWTTVEDIFTEEEIHPLKFVQSISLNGEDFIESFDVARYKYDDVLFARRSKYIQYPNFSSSGYSYFYQYKDSLYGQAIQWAYKDRWKPIVRDSIENRISSVILTYPNYVFDYMGNEIQLVADEGDYTLEFSPPVFSFDGSIESDAYFKLGNGPKRYIDLSSLDWKDIEAWQNGITITPKYKHYVTESGWNSDVDLWSENSSEGSKDEAHYYELEDDFGDKTKVYYFRGIKLDIKGDRFPYEVADYDGAKFDSVFEFLESPSHEVRTIDNNEWFSYPYSRLYNDTKVNQAFEWTKEDAALDKHIVIDLGTAVSIKEIEIGYFKGKNVWKESLSYSFFPGCEVHASNDNLTYTKIFDQASDNFADSVKLASLVKGKINLSRDGLLSNIIDVYRYYKIVFKNWSEPRACFILNYIRFKEMHLKKVYESIKIYENKFIVSKASTKDFNTHGTESDPLLEPAADGSTIYVSETKVQHIVGNSSYKTLSRTRSRAASERYEDKSETYGKYTDITFLETRQYDLFDSARDKLSGDSVFVYAIPDDYIKYLETFGMSFPSGYLHMISNVPRLREIQEIPKSGKIWNASGHKYTWEKSYIYWDCCSASAISRCQWAWTCDDYNYKHLNHAGDTLEESISPLYLYEHMFEILEMQWGIC